MHFTNCSLKNFGQHKDLSIDLLPGITGILGGNGSGKSTFADAGLYFSITGDVPYDSKGDWLAWGATNGYTQLTFTDQDIEYFLQRNIHDAKAILEWTVDGKKCQISGQAKVNAKMEEILGMPFDVFRETCFCPQTSLIEIITMTSAQRMDYFGKLCDVGKAEKIRSTLQQKINNLPQAQDFGGSIEALKLSIDKDEKSVEALSNEILHRRAIIPEGGFLKIMSDLTVESQKHDKAVVDKKIADAEANLKTLRTNTIKGLPEKVDMPSKEELQVLELSNTAYGFLAELEDLVGKRDRLEQSLPVELVQPSDETLKGLENGIHSDRARYELAKLGVCPTCGSSVHMDNSGDIIRLYQESLSRLETEKVSFQKSCKAFDENCKVRRNVQSEMALYQKRITFLTDELNKPLYVNVLTPEALEEVVNRKNLAQTYLEALAKVNDQEQQRQKQIIQVEGYIEQLRQVPVIAKEEKDEVLLKLGKVKKDNDELNNLELEMASVQSSLASNRKSLHDYSLRQETFKKITQCRRDLERVREVFHRDHAPKVVLGRMVKGFNTCLEFYLAKFSVPYVAKLTEDFELIVSVKGKEWVSARRLSGGQKVALVVAFRFALSEMFAAKVPLLVFDEPTAWLDEKNIGCMVEVLQMAKSFIEKGVYVLLVTHETALLPAMTRTTVIGA